MDNSSPGEISQTTADRIKAIWKKRFEGDTFLDWLFKRWLPEPDFSVQVEETELGMSLRFPPGMDVELIEWADGTLIERADGTFEPI